MPASAAQFRPDLPYVTLLHDTTLTKPYSWAAMATAAGLKVVPISEGLPVCSSDLIGRWLVI